MAIRILILRNQIYKTIFHIIFSSLKQKRRRPKTGHRLFYRIASKHLTILHFYSRNTLKMLYIMSYDH